MDQESAPQTGQQKAINIITIVCLIVFPPIGLILMWLLSDWRKKIKIIITAVIILIAISFIGFYIRQVVILKSLYKELKEPIEEERKDEKVITRMEGIQRELYEMLIEAHFGSNVYTNISCDHPRIKSFCEGIENLVGVKPTVYSTPNRYCAYIKLPSGKYNCIDNVLQDFSVTMPENPSSPGHCDGITFVCQEEKEEKTDTGINIVSPAGGEKWKEGETHPIIWEQWGLIGKRVKICLLGNDNSYQPVLAKENYQGECSDMKSYQIGEVFAGGGKYDWEIPINLSERFWDSPTFYRIKIMPLEKIIEPGVSFKYGFSDYFEIFKRK